MTTRVASIDPKTAFVNGLTRLVTANIIHKPWNEYRTFAPAGFLYNYGLNVAPLLYFPVVFKPLPKNVYIAMSQYGVIHVNTAFCGHVYASADRFLHYLYHCYLLRFPFFLSKAQMMDRVNAPNGATFIRYRTWTRNKYNYEEFDISADDKYLILTSDVWMKDEDDPDAEERLILDCGSVNDGIPRSWEECSSDRIALDILKENSRVRIFDMLKEKKNAKSYWRYYEPLSLENYLISYIMTEVKFDGNTPIGILEIQKTDTTGLCQCRLDYDLMCQINCYLAKENWWCGRLKHDYSPRRDRSQQYTFDVTFYGPYTNTLLAEMRQKDVADIFDFITTYCDTLIVIIEGRSIRDEWINLGMGCRKCLICCAESFPRGRYPARGVEVYRFENGHLVNGPGVLPLVLTG